VNMSPRPAPAAPAGFAGLAAAMAGQPLHEFCPAEAGAEMAALGFSLSLASGWVGGAGVVWAGEEGVFAEEGAPYPPGLAQFGLDPARLIVIRAAKRDEALWAAEQALTLPGAVVICALAQSGKPLDLKATRRLLLFAERNQARCLLVRPLTDASAAWTRWRIAAAPSVGEEGELGQPAYALELVRSRFGAAGAKFIVDWNADARSFAERDVARDLSAASFDGQADPIRARA
jgi:protein ImuA